MIPRLHYFPIIGRGEPIRLAFHLGNIPFEDVRVQPDEWRAGGKSRAPYGQLPYLDLGNGKILAESQAILTYAAKRAGLIPLDPLNHAEAEQALSILRDTDGPYRELRDSTAEKQKPAEEIKRVLKKLDKAIGTTQDPATGFVAGGQLSYADLVLFTRAYLTMTSMLPELSAIYRFEYPNISKCVDAVLANPDVQQYYTKRGEHFAAPPPTS